VYKSGEHLLKKGHNSVLLVQIWQVKEWIWALMDI